MSITPDSMAEYCLGGAELSAPPGKAFTVSSPPDTSASLSAKGVKTASFIGCLGLMK